MVRDTVQKMGRHLENLAEKRIPIGVSFDLLGRRARSIEEVIVIEVMREAYAEMDGTRHRKAS